MSAYATARRQPAADAGLRLLDASGRPLGALPRIEGTLGPPAYDVRDFYDETGGFAFDPGYGATASCRSAITYIDGENGVLLYRGYPVDQLAENSRYLEVCHLLLHGELPDRAALEAFERTITHHTMVHEQVLTFFRGFRRDAHPMAVLCGAIGGLSAFYDNKAGPGTPEERLVAAHRLIAKMPTIAAMAYKYAAGQPFMYPQNALGHAANLLYMTFAVPAEPYEPDPVLTRALDRFLILHADHGQNASTSTVRLAASTGANPFACIAAGVAALWGPAHGGANEAVLAMLQEIGTKERIPDYIARAKDRDDPFRLMGFGHRVYKSYDPRARIMRETCHEVLNHLGITEEPLLELALELERRALEDEFFVSHGLYPNVDFYSGLMLRAIGFPVSMFSALFAVARCAGWIAQWLEMAADPELRIGRPRQLYCGPTRRDYVPLDRR